MSRFPVGSRKRLRQVEKSATLTPDPVQRLRYLQQCMKTLSLPAHRRWLPSRLAAAITLALVLAVLIWRAI